MVKAQGDASPPPELQKLAFLVGTFSARQTPYAPDGTALPVSTSTHVGAWTARGGVLRQTTLVDGEEWSTSLITYDPEAKLYRIWNFFQPTVKPQEITGRFEGSKFVTVSPLPAAGTEFRSSIEPKAGGEIAVIGETKDPASGQWKKRHETILTPKR